MARRSAYTKVVRTSFVRQPHVAGMGDTLWRGFQCLNPTCTNQLVVRDDVITSDFNITCDRCGYLHQAGEVEKVYDFELIDTRDNSIVEAGPFEILHDDYIAEAARLKYCVVCSALKPISLFDLHGSRDTGRQGECRLCKQSYNSIKNQTRTVDQHREASQKRRLYTQFDDAGKIDIQAIYDRFQGQCFKCNMDLSADMTEVGVPKLGNLDHTLPVFYLWPLTVDNATLLCRLHNGEKAQKWPGAFYTNDELRRLSALTGIDYRVLEGDPFYNPEAVRRLSNPRFVEDLFEKFARYPEELLRLRNRIMDATGYDFLSNSAQISNAWRERADAMR